MSSSSHRRIEPSDEEASEVGRFRRFVRKAWKPALGVVVLGVIAIGVAIGVAYSRVTLPDAQTAAKAQATIYYYSDGKTILYKEGTNRESVALDQIPPTVRNAVLAAEDRNFYHEPGISVRGIMRAVYSTATGKQVQGGSTITQEFARNYYNTLSQQRTVSRKVKEILISVKLGKEKSKSWVLDQYLNTIYYGRGAYGIQAASKAYFHRGVSQLSPSQGAYLAAIIQSPNYLPTHRAALQARWSYVVQGMQKQGWLTPQQQTKMRFPHTIKPQSAESNLHGEARYLYLAASAEAGQTLQSKGLGGRARLDQGGLKIVTTFNKRDVIAMGDAINNVLHSNYRKQGVRAGMASVEPSTGEIRAMYGGHPTYVKVQGKRQLQYVDDAIGEGPQIGSSFKPYTLATALSQNIGLNSRLAGHSPMCFHNAETELGRCGPGDTDKVTNDSGEQAGAITLTEATAKSINTAYVGLCLKTGIENIQKTELAVGFPGKSVSTDMDHNHCRSTLGTISLPPLYQASGYATFANGGQHMQSHTIRTISTFDDEKLVDNRHEQPKVAFSQDVAADATYAMQQVVKPGGTAGNVLSGFGRPIAGKTGTTNENMSAWFVGYAPQMSTAVGLWRVAPHGKHKGQQISLNGITGSAGGQVYGGTVPAKIWNEYMHTALAHMPVKEFPPPAHIGDTHLWASPPAQPSKTPTPTRSNSRFPTDAPPTNSPTTPPTTSPPPTLPVTPSPTSTCHGICLPTHGPSPSGPGEGNGPESVNGTRATGPAP